MFIPLDVPFPDTFNTAARGINAHGQSECLRHQQPRPDRGDYVDSPGMKTFHGFLATPHEE